MYQRVTEKLVESSFSIDTDADETSKCVGIWENQPKTKGQKKSSKSDTTYLESFRIETHQNDI